MKAVLFKPGDPNLMYIRDAEKPIINEDEVLIRVYGSAVNRADTLQRKGLYNPPPNSSPILGLEVSGIIEKTGENVKTLKIGDRVMALVNGGGYAEFCKVRHDHVLTIPENVKLVDAGSIPEVWTTAWQLINTIGKLQDNQTVLIHAGASGVGLAAIQLCKLKNATIFTTCGTAEKCQLTCKLGAKLSINYKTENFKEIILKQTNNRGVDLILDCIGASYWQMNSDVSAIDSTWVLYGLMGGGKIDGDLLAKILRKRITMTGTTLRNRSDEYKAKLISQIQQHVIPGFSDGKFVNVIDKTFALNKIVDAHIHMENNANIGKISLKIKDDDNEAHVYY